MAQLHSVKQTWDEYKGWAIVGLITAFIVNFWGFFKSLGDAAKGGADDLLGGIKEGAQDRADKAKAKAASGGKVAFSSDQVAKFKQDAETLANMLGRGPGISMVDFVKDQQGAFTMLKRDYSRLNLWNNKPWRWKDPVAKKGIIPQDGETSASVKNPYNWRVLSPFYKEASGGHDLLGDIKYYITGSAYKKLLTWIL